MSLTSLTLLSQAEMHRVMNLFSLCLLETDDRHKTFNVKKPCDERIIFAEEVMFLMFVC